MISLFSKQSLMIAESLSFKKTLYAFDFDGTLSKIARTPTAAKLSSTTEKLVEELARFAPVAIISGRSLDDLKARINFKPYLLVGNHGLEGLGISAAELAEAKNLCREWLQVLTEANFSTGIEIEDKTYSLAVHYRKSRNKKEDKKKLKRAISLFTPQPRIINGKSVVNILPPRVPNKGHAILELMRKCEVHHGFYIGDDDTDEDIFSLPERKIMTVRIGYKQKSRAQFYIDRQNEINRLLRTLINFYEKQQS
jgi:trehalose 6-phosphate phosphatase